MRQEGRVCESVVGSRACEGRCGWGQGRGWGAGAGATRVWLRQPLGVEFESSDPQCGAVCPCDK